MKKTRLWLVVFAATICLTTFIAGCVEATENNAAFSIANKTELQEVWFEEDDDREVRLKMPSGITLNDVMVTSSNPAAVLVETEVKDGKKTFCLKAAGAGISKITATAFDEEDSLNITVKQALKEIALTNKGELEKIVNGEERTVEYSVKPDAFDVEDANVEITSSDKRVITVNGDKIKAVGKGTATLTVKAGKFSDSVEISVIDLSAPSFAAENGATVNGLKGDDISLPSALSCDGKDLSANVVADCPDGISFDKNTMTVKASATGNYKITLSVSDPRNENLTASVELNLGVYRKIFADYNGYGNVDYETYAEGKQYVADSEQVAGFDRWDATFASFDMQPSKIYYAEATFSFDGKADWSTFYGMTHSFKGDATRWLGAYIDRGAAENRAPEFDGEEQRYWNGARNFRVKDFDILNDNDVWQLNENNNPKTQILHSDGLYRFRGLNNLNNAASPFRFAVARINESFYYFVDGTYVATVVNSYYAGEDTVAGIFQQSGLKTEIKNIFWCNGDEAIAKVNELTSNGGAVFGKYAPNDWWKGKNRSEFTPSTDGSGFTFDIDSIMDENEGIITPYIYFDGSFTFEWEYAPAQILDNGSWDRYMCLEVRTANYNNTPSIKFGANYLNHGNGKACIYRKNGDTTIGNPAGADSLYDWFEGTKIKYSLTRLCTSDEDGNPVAKYTLIASEGSKTSVWEFEDRGTGDWKNPCEPAIVFWKNVGVKGAFTNVKWSIPENGLSIGNKEALQLKWTVGDADRTVVTDITGALKGPAKVTSSDTGVISVDGNVIKAVGRGTATVTVRIGDYTDEVEITVTPALASVTITNKDSLTAEWLDTSTDAREVTVAYDPADVYGAGNSPFTLTSDDASVVAVGQDGKTLRVVGAGSATVTLSVNGKAWDSVTVNVKSTKTTLALKDNVTDIYGVEGEEIALPEVKALSPDGEDISSQVSVSCADGKVTVTGLEKVTATERGTYTLTYTLAGAEEVVLNVNVQRKVFGATAGQNAGVNVTYDTGAEHMQEGKEVAYLNGAGMKFAQMNVAAGKIYYAEVTFKADSEGTSSLLYGISHSEKGEGANRYLTSWVDRGAKYTSATAGYITDDRTLKVKDFDMTAQGWTDTDPATSATPVLYVYNDGKSRTGDLGDAFPLTLGVMRNGSFFYVFINGEYVLAFNSEYFADKDTVPAIFEMSGVETQITGAVYLSGDDAVAKFDTLTQNGAQIKHYRPFKENNGWQYGNPLNSSWIDTASGADGLGYTVKDQSKTGDNDALVSAYVMLSGNFTFEYELEWAKDMNVSDNWSNVSILDVLDYKYQSVGEYKFTRVVHDAGKVCVNVKGFSDGDWLSEAGKLKIKLQRVGSDFIITVCNADGTQLMTKTNSGCTTAPVLIGWKNKALKATYSNISWSADAAQN